MVQFVCDSCGAIKDSAETWVLGLAAEAVGAASARREVNILSGWDRPNAVHALAVHFCSLECKDDYVARLFRPETLALETAVETRTVKRALPIREVGGKIAARHKAQTRKPGRKKSA